MLAVSDAEEVQELIERAMAARSVAATAMNAQSSRSHSVFVLWIEGRNRELGQQFKSSLNMVDLAGSERLKDSLAEGDRKEETVNINKSLSAVKVRALVHGADRRHSTVALPHHASDWPPGARPPRPVHLLSRPTLCANPQTCFNEMVNRSKGGRAHVNYRSSKLTWLLKPALEGEAKTLMFVNW